MSAAPDTISLREARALALGRGGLLGHALTGLPSKARGAGPSARAAAHRVIEAFGYLQLDTISVTGARSHTLVLLSRLEGMDAALGDRLLVPGAPLFEYWAHEASWVPMDLFPCFAFRRERFRSHPWWGDIITPNRALADDLLRRARDDGGFRSSDLEGSSGTGFWRGKPAKRVAEALWSSGDLAIRERRGFQRVYDIPERVLPAGVLAERVGPEEARRRLILRSFDGHGWAEEGTIAATFRMRKTSPEFRTALAQLVESREIVSCDLADGRRRVRGWIRPRDLDLVPRFASLRPRPDRGVFLSPFDPLLWDRARVRLLFGFEQVLEIYVPQHKRVHGYYVLPLLAGGRLVGRADLKADREAGLLRVRRHSFEANADPASARAALDAAVARHAAAVDLPVDPRFLRATRRGATSTKG